MHRRELGESNVREWKIQLPGILRVMEEFGKEILFRFFHMSGALYQCMVRRVG
jgi:hypothetical protein